MSHKPPKNNVPAYNIVLTGFMGTGKTTVGKILAERLNFRFLDMDAEIEKKAGKPISAIFAQEGEPHFRELERQLVQELSALSGLVIATGGGVVLNGDNIKDFSRTGLVVCLQATVDDILQRIAQEHHRPLLEKDSDRKGRITTLLKERAPFYARIQTQVKTTDRNPDEIASEIIDHYKTFQPTPP